LVREKCFSFRRFEKKLSLHFGRFPFPNLRLTSFATMTSQCFIWFQKSRPDLDPPNQRREIVIFVLSELGDVARGKQLRRRDASRFLILVAEHFAVCIGDRRAHPEHRNRAHLQNGVVYFIAGQDW
jgi:hypothetical protein